MNLSRALKTQISIFILISVMIVLLLFFLLNIDVESKENQIQDNKDLIYSTEDSDVYLLKDNVDYCLEKELKRAIVISGTRGGFIYKKPNENYLPGVLPIDIYKSNFLSNLEISSSYLSERTLVYTSQFEVNAPPLEVNNSNYVHSVKEDMQRFILNEFLSCIDIDSIKSRGYDVVHDDFIGKVKYNLGSGELVVDGVIGKVNDSVNLDTTDNFYVGVITKVDENSKETHVKFNSSYLISPSSIVGSNVINTNSSLNVNITFQDESVIAKLSFPITISKGNFQTSLKNSEASVNVRFKYMLLLSESLSEYKHKQNHSFDLTDKDLLEKYLQGEMGPTISYFKKTDKKNIEIIKNEINDSDEYKAVVFTIIDYDSKILGEPFVYNFGYENHAPVIDKTFLGQVVFDENILFTTPVNKKINYNLREVTKDPQYYDSLNYKGLNHYYFRPFSYSSRDASFTLYENGTLNFIGFIEKQYSYEILVTDGEAKSKYNFKFIVGLPENKDNFDAKDCFKFEPYAPNQFPIDNSLKGIFSYTDPTTSTLKLYAFSNYIDYSTTNIKGNSILKFSKGCIFDNITYGARYSINGGRQIVLTEPYEIEISSNISTASNVEVEIFTKSSGEKMANSESYKITVYPAACLGPFINDPQLKYIRDAGGFGSGSGTCCDIAPVKASVSSKNPKAFTLTSSNLKTSGVVADPLMYFSFTPESNLNIASFDKSLLYVKNEHGQLNDIVQLKVGSTIFSGRIIEIDNNNNNLTKIKLEASLDEIASVYKSFGREDIYSSNETTVIFSDEELSNFNITMLTGFFDIETKSIWASFGSDSTSLYEGKAIFTCQGKFPRVQENIDRITSTTSDLTGNILAYSTLGYKKESFSSGNPVFNLKKVNSAGACSLVDFESVSELKFLLKTSSGIEIPMSSGLVLQNSDIYVGPLPSTFDYVNKFILCDDSWFAHNGDNNWIKNGNVGLGGPYGSVYLSKGYCYLGSTTCSGRVNPLNYKSISDSLSTCEDKYVNVPLGIDNVAFGSSTWVCGSYNYCFGSCECGGGPQPFISRNNPIACSGNSFGCPFVSSVSSCTPCVAKVEKTVYNSVLKRNEIILKCPV